MRPHNNNNNNVRILNIPAEGLEHVMAAGFGYKISVRILNIPAEGLELSER